MTSRAVRIGLTGPIGCGKSTVGGWLGERADVIVIDADDLARDVLDRGTPEVGAVYARFGAGLRSPDGSLDRDALGRIVFADPVALGDLERIVHPGVRARILDRLEAADRTGATVVVIEAIKLVEGGLAALCDEVWLIDCAADRQHTRLLGRGMEPSDIRSRIAAQGDLADRLRPQADRVIDASGPAPTTRLEVERALAQAMSGTRRPTTQSDSLRT